MTAAIRRGHRSKTAQLCNAWAPLDDRVIAQRDWRNVSISVVRRDPFASVAHAPKHTDGTS
jgi:hypothetical protein